MAALQARRWKLKPFFVYVLECADGSFYVGSTDDLERRFGEHQMGLRGHTCKRLPVVLVYSCPLPTRDEARVREHQIKGWGHAKKQALIGGDWERVHALARRSPREAPG
jgi:predicted GIY-YIG superfamily endonuclease